MRYHHPPGTSMMTAGSVAGIATDTYGETSTALTGDWGIPRANVDVTDDAPIYIPSFGHGELYG
jgi:hypothetical protein